MKFKIYWKLVQHGTSEIEADNEEEARSTAMDEKFNLIAQEPGGLNDDDDWNIEDIEEV